MKKGKFSGEESSSTSPSQSVMQDDNSNEGLVIDIESPTGSVAPCKYCDWIFIINDNSVFHVLRGVISLMV